MKGLQQPATITYFNQTSRFQEGKDLLDRYANLSPKIHVDYVDPDRNPQAARDGRRHYLRLHDRANRRAKKEQAKSVSEEEITGAIIHDLKTSTRTVCFVAGSGEHQIDDSTRDGYSQFKDMLGKDSYSAKSISLLEKAEVPPDCTVLVIAGPRSDYQQPAVDAIAKCMSRMAGARCSCWIRH